MNVYNSKNGCQESWEESRYNTTTMDKKTDYISKQSI